MFDYENMFSVQQSLVGEDESILSQHVIRLVKDNREATVQGWRPIHDPGRGNPVPIAAQITEDVVGGTTVKAQVVASDDEEFNTGVEVLQETGAVPVAQLKAGYRFNLSTLPEVSKRFLALRYVITGTVTAGRVEAGLVLVKNTAY